MHRRYNRWWSRFDQPDPYDGSYDLTDPQSFNRYSYVQNDPVNFIDPNGQFPVGAVIAFLTPGLIGFSFGAAGSAVGQIGANIWYGRSPLENFSWRAVGVAAGIGFVGATVAVYLPASITVAVVYWAGVNVVQYVATQAVTNQQPTSGGIAISAGLGAAAGRITGPAARSSGPRWDLIGQPALSRAYNAQDFIDVNLAFGNLVRSTGSAAASNSVPSDAIDSSRPRPAQNFFIRPPILNNNGNWGGGNTSLGLLHHFYSSQAGITSNFNGGHLGTITVCADGSSYISEWCAPNIIPSRN
jgi:hypothetical protein